MSVIKRMISLIILGVKLNAKFHEVQNSKNCNESSV